MPKARKKPIARSQPNRRLLWLLGIILAAVIAAGAVYISSAPKRAEQALKSASLANLQAASQREPDNPRVFYYLGLRSQQAGKLADSAQAYARASQLDPDNSEYCIGLAKMTVATQGAQASFGILNTFLKTHPRSAPAHVALAQLFQLSGYAQRAADEATTATTLAPNDGDAWQIIGTAAMSAHNYFAAESALQKAVAAKPADWHNRVALGNALLRLSRDTDAIASYREAIRIAPSEAAPHLELGKALLGSAASPAEIEDARKTLLESTKLPATFSSEGIAYANLYIGQSYEKEGRWREALPWLKQVESQPANTDGSGNAVDAHFELARVYQALGDGAGAARETKLHQQIVDYDIERTNLINRLNAAPKDTVTRLKLARLYAAHGEDASAARLFHSVLQLAPNLADSVRPDLEAIRRRHSSM